LRNAASTEVPADLTVQGTLPDWLTGFHYTLSPGIFEIKYPKMVVVNGEPQQETRTFRFGHWFDKYVTSRFFCFMKHDHQTLFSLFLTRLFYLSPKQKPSKHPAGQPVFVLGQ